MSRISNTIPYHIDQNLYIVMELVEGASLQDHFNSLTEKKQTMDEPRIWRIFVQLSLGMRYLHKDKVGGISIVCL